MSNILPYVRGETELDQRRAMPVVIVDTTGGYNDPAGRKAYALATAGVLATATNVRGGDYIWALEGTVTADTVYRLMTTGPAGVTFYPMKVPGTTTDVTLTLTTTAPLVSRGIGVGQGASFKIELVSGTAPANLASNLAGL